MGLLQTWFSEDGSETEHSLPSFPNFKAIAKYWGSEIQSIPKDLCLFRLQEDRQHTSPPLFPHTANAWTNTTQSNYSNNIYGWIMFQLPHLLLKARKSQSTWTRQSANAGEFPLGTKCCFFHSALQWVCLRMQHSVRDYSFRKLVFGFFSSSLPISAHLSGRSRCEPLGLGWVLLLRTFSGKSKAWATRWLGSCIVRGQSLTLFLALWSSLMSHIIDLNDLIVGGKFKCAILITCYPRQIKSLCVKSTLLWITYKTSIYWINVGSNFILMWLTVCFSPLKWDKNTQTYNCVATLHLTCLFLLLSF